MTIKIISKYILGPQLHKEAANAITSSSYKTLSVWRRRSHHHLFVEQLISYSSNKITRTAIWLVKKTTVQVDLKDLLHLS